jgi:hypothetical protein
MTTTKEQITKWFCERNHIEKNKLDKYHHYAITTTFKYIKEQTPASDQPSILCPCCGSDKTYRTEAIHCNRCASTSEI